MSSLVPSSPVFSYTLGTTPTGFRSNRNFFGSESFVFSYTFGMRPKSFRFEPKPDLRQGLRQTHFSVPNRKFRFRIICVFIHSRHATENFSVRTETWFATRSTPNPLSVPVTRLAIKILKGHNRKTEITFSVHLVTNPGLEGTEIRPAANRPTLPHIETLYRGPVAKRGVSPTSPLHPPPPGCLTDILS